MSEPFYPPFTGPKGFLRNIGNYNVCLHFDIISSSPDIVVEVFVNIFGGSPKWVQYDMTSNNGSAMT